MMLPSSSSYTTYHHHPVQVRKSYILVQRRNMSLLPILETMNGEAQQLRDSGKPDEALPIYLEIAEGLEGENELLNLGYTYGSIGLCYLAMSNHAQALEYYSKSIPIITGAHGDQFPLVGILYAKIGICLSALDRNDEGLDYLMRAQPIVEANFDNEHPDVANVYQNISSLLFKMNRLSDAGEYLKKLVVIQMQVFGVDDARTLSTQDALKIVEDNEKIAGHASKRR